MLENAARTCSNRLIYMLAGFADIPPVAKKYFEEAEQQCERMYERRKPGEEEEIITYRKIITEGLEGLVAEERHWKLEEGIYITSSDEEAESVSS